MKILILTCATGGGHLRAAAALEAYIRETTTHDVVQMDFLKSIGKIVDKTICDSYLFMAKRTPALFGRLYKTTNKDNLLADMVPHTTDLMSLQLYPRLQEVAPDVILSVHPFATEMVSSLKEYGKITCPLICVMTDYGVHRAWIAPRVDAYVVACDDMVDALRRHGVAGDRIFPYGIPVHDVFFDKEDQPKLLTEMGLSPDVPTLLFMAGSMGVSNIAELYRRLDEAPIDLQMIIITGKNKKLYELFEYETKRSSKKCVLLEFTQEVERYMHAADLIVTKPGGLTVSEALACNLPLAVFDAIPGQEEDNANFLQTHDMGVRITKDNFFEVVSSLIAHKEDLRRMRESCRAFDKSKANENIVALAADLAKQFAGLNPDITFQTHKAIFNLRTAAVLIQGDQVLLTRDASSPTYYLPGGRVKINEAAEDALTRELSEELGVTLKPERPLFFCQSFFTEKARGGRYHEVCTYFAADAEKTDLMARGEEFSGREKDITFRWVPLSALDTVPLEPKFLKERLLRLPDSPELITVNS